MIFNSYLGAPKALINFTRFFIVVFLRVVAGLEVIAFDDIFVLVVVVVVVVVIVVVVVVVVVLVVVVLVVVVVVVVVLVGLVEASVVFLVVGKIGNFGYSIDGITVGLLSSD